MAIKREKVIKAAEKYVAKGKLEAAINQYRKVLKEEPDDINTLNRVGDLYARLEKYGEAVRLFSQIAEQYTRDGFFLKAIAIYKKIIKLDPASLQVYERLAELYHRQGLLNEARTQYQVLADYYQKHENATSAITIYQRMSEMEPENPSYHLKLAELYAGQRLTDKALSAYERLADVMLAAGSIDEAAQVYTTALEVAPENLDFVRSAVSGLNDAGHLGAAARVLAKAAELNPAAAGLSDLIGSPEPPAESPGGAMDGTGSMAAAPDAAAGMVPDATQSGVMLAMDDAGSQPAFDEATGAGQAAPMADAATGTGQAAPMVDAASADAASADAASGEATSSYGESTGDGFYPAQPSYDADSFQADDSGSTVTSGPSPDGPSFGEGAYEPPSFESPGFGGADETGSGAPGGLYAEPTADFEGEEIEFTFDLDDDEIPETQVLPPADLEDETAAPARAGAAEADAARPAPVEDVPALARPDLAEPADSDEFAEAEIELELDPAEDPAADPGSELPESATFGESGTFREDDLVDPDFGEATIAAAPPDSEAAPQAIEESPVEIEWSMDAVAGLDIPLPPPDDQPVTALPDSGFPSEAAEEPSAAAEPEVFEISLDLDDAESETWVESPAQANVVEPAGPSSDPGALDPGALDPGATFEPAPTFEPGPTFEEGPSLAEVPVFEQAPASEQATAAEQPPAFESAPTFEEAPLAPPSTPTAAPSPVPSTAAPVVDAAPPAVRREEDLLAEARVFSKYGLKEKAIDRLSDLLASHPEHLGGLALRIQIDLDSGDTSQVASRANHLFELSRHQGETEIWDGLQPELEKAGFTIGSAGITDDRTSQPAEDDRIAQLLEDLSLEGFEAPRTQGPSPVESLLASNELGAAAAESAQAPAAAAGGPDGGFSLADALADVGLDEMADLDPAALVGDEAMASGTNPAGEGTLEKGSPAASAPGATTAGAEISQPASADARADDPTASEVIAFQASASEVAEAQSTMPGAVVAGAASGRAPAAEPTTAEMMDETGMSWLEEPTPVPGSEAAAAGETIFDEEDDFFDLAAELEAELGEGMDSIDEGAITSVEPQEQSLEEIIEGFKQGVAENLSPEDYDTHFNLGIAYREMGLMDEAIGEFQLASKDPRYLVECASMLGICFQEKGLLDLSVKWYQKGLAAPDISEEATLGLLYDMGDAYEAMGNPEAAHKTFIEIYGMNTNFRDVTARLQQLGAL